MTREEIIKGLKLLKDNLVYVVAMETTLPLKNDKNEWVDVHELLFETISALEQEPVMQTGKPDSEYVFNPAEPCDTISINSMVETIATKVTEDTENFIFETIKLYCEEITKREISKKDLEKALTQYFSKEPCGDAISRADMYEEIEDWLNLSRYYHPHSKNNKMPIDELRARIEQLPSVQPKPIECEDAISREAVKELYCRICMDKNICYRSKENCEDLRLFDNLPSVPSRKGHWVKKGAWNTRPVCSECGAFNNSKYKNFCPNCGADMRGDTDADSN